MIVYLKVEVQLTGVKEHTVGNVVERIRTALQNEFKLPLENDIEITPIEHAGIEEK